MSREGIGTKVRAMSPPRFTTTEAARLVGRSEDTLVRWRKDEVYVPKEKRSFGNVDVWLYTEDDILAMKEIGKTLRPGRKRSA